MDERRKTDITDSGDSTTADREIVTTRVFDAPRELVYRAWTDPEQVVQWWGPRGFRNTNLEMDVRVGGRWRFVMHMADGTTFPNRIVYSEVIKNQRLAYEHDSDRDDDPEGFSVTVDFTDEAAKTRVTMRAVLRTAEQLERVKKFGAVEGGRQTLERLAEHLMTAHEVAFSISRTFDAPRSLVWKAHTEAERLAKWWGPKGLAMTTSNVDFRAGGLFHYGLTGPDGKVMWGRFVYRDVVPEERIVYVSSFSDETAGVTKAPFGMDWPLEVLNVLTMTEERGATTVSLRGMPLDATPEQLKVYKQFHGSMQQGFGGTYDQLADYLAKTKGRA